MKFIIYSLILLSVNAFALDKRVETVIDYLRDTSASVNGSISVDEPIDVYQGKYGWLNVGMKVQSKKPIGFSVSDQHLQISSDEGLTVSFAGFTAKVKNIYYHETTGKFEVRTDTFMGIAEGTFKEKIEQVLNEKYKPKMIEAFKKLKTIREKKNLADVNQVVSAVAGIFSTGKSIPMPTIRGDIDLSFYPKQDKELKIDKFTAKIQKGDAISAGVNFVKTKDNLAINGVEFRSSKGLRLHGETKFPEIASLNFQTVQINDRGVQLGYDIGAEEVLAGFQLIIGVIGQYSGHPSRALQECDPIRLKYIRDSIDGTLKKELSNMIKNYRETLLKGGASPQLLAALE